MPYFDQEFGEELDRPSRSKFDLLLGRKTYEIFPSVLAVLRRKCAPRRIANCQGHKKIRRFGSARSDTSWQGSVLLRDIADVKRLKQEDGPNLVTQGSTELVHALLANDLVDAMSIFTCRSCWRAARSVRGRLGAAFVQATARAFRPRHPSSPLRARQVGSRSRWRARFTQQREIPVFF